VIEHHEWCGKPPSCVFYQIKPEVVLVLNPSKTGNWIDAILDDFFVDQLSDTTKDWKERNKPGVISGSKFAACKRQSYYAAIDQRGDDKKDIRKAFDSFSRRIMFLGHKSEEYVFGAIRAAQKAGKLTGSLHTDQQSAPVNLHLIKTGTDGAEYDFGVTTDGVVEDILLWGGETRRVYYPIELKQTDRPYQSWWKKTIKGKDYREFDRNPWQERQLVHYMAIAADLGYTMPYGMLKYYRRIDYDTLTWVYYWREYESLIFDAFSGCNAQEYSFVELDYLVKEDRQAMSQHIFDVEAKSLPPPSSDLSSYICDACPYKAQCWMEQGNPRKRDVPKIKTSS